MAAASGTGKRSVQEWLSDERFLNTMRSMAAASIDPQRLLAVVGHLLQRESDLALCEPASLLSCVLLAGRLGLDPSPVLGQCYILPFDDNSRRPPVKLATFVIGYKGYVELFYRSGKVLDVYGATVREGDLFEYDLGTEPYIHHRPSLDKRGDILAAYSVLHLENQGLIAHVMGTPEIAKFKARSRAAQRERGPWFTDPDPMHVKTTLRQIARFAPVSPDATRAAAQDGGLHTRLSLEDLGGIDLLDVPPDSPPPEDAPEPPAGSPPASPQAPQGAPGATPEAEAPPERGQRQGGRPPSEPRGGRTRPQAASLPSLQELLTPSGPTDPQPATQE